MAPLTRIFHLLDHAVYLATFVTLLCTSSLACTYPTSTWQRKRGRGGGPCGSIFDTVHVQGSRMVSLEDLRRFVQAGGADDRHATPVLQRFLRVPSIV
eukprot:SAG11_NODE_851_length_6875_cov_8.193034_9_plen_98_part_00